MADRVRQEMMTALCLADGGEGKKLFQFVSSNEAGELEKIANRFLHGPRTDDLKMRLKNLRRFGHHLAFDEIHAGWILEETRRSPRLLAVMLQSLSREKSEFLLGQLTGEERQRFPRKTRPVSPELVGHVRRLVERKLGVVSALKAEGLFSFSDLSCLKVEDLRALLKDVGIGLITKAFAGINPQIVRAFLARFVAADAAAIRERLQEEREISAEARRIAQGFLLSLTLGQIPSNQFLLEIGFSLLVQAFTPEELSAAETIYRKFSVAEGYPLRRFLQERRTAGGRADPVLREEILKRLRFLANCGKVRRYWKDEREVEPTVILPGESA